ncbi:MAG: Holliday junction branch migration protein RuvA [Myxococcales bacterium]|nr:Holliday junction branch migration protein RuvA [Myxococcales bacterium]
MIGNLRGKVIDRGVSSVLIECAGVGYEVHASTHTLASMSEIGAEVSLRIFTQYLDHKMSLYGFADVGERELFDLLVTVKNVGPSSAIKILSAGAGPVEIAQLIAAKNSKGLLGIKGVGKKTSEMLVVELHEKCEALLMTWEADGMAMAVPTDGAAAQSKSASKRSPVHNDVVLALVQLGYRKQAAEKVVDHLPDDPTATLESVMRQALQAMPR